jgi:Rps23 Pro-64 3,4-dihydroxylase Tpa1-like proline 4-hydroxylase
MFFNKDALFKALTNFKNNQPFDHCVVEDFLDLDLAQAMEKEFLDYEDPKWFYYKNAIEDKKALNDWNVFPALTYKVFRELMSDDFLQTLSQGIGVPLYQDPGLHGGGWHIHGRGGNLNPHCDYSIHPKIRLQRKINIIIYVSSDLKDEHGGHLGLWAHDPNNNKPGELLKVIQPKFNRAVIFDTTQNSWHGMCSPLTQPEGIYRKSLAIYYLTDPPENVNPREKALYAPRDDQKGDKDVDELIKMRSNSVDYAQAYRTDRTNK